mgnify:CR=1 FL=1
MRYVLLTAAALLAIASWWSGPGGHKFKNSWRIENERAAMKYAKFE